LKYLNGKDLAVLTQVNRAAYFLFDDKMWKAFFQKDFPLRPVARSLTGLHKYAEAIKQLSKFANYGNNGFHSFSY
jgi:hypothetical protein